ncbi:MAG: hypothetical protein K2W95_01220 [Candidatus Obscuribacterales bacterium]|nr:hypothetical protein [Candidatus Obscuribacterales bacterium]
MNKIKRSSSCKMTLTVTAVLLLMGANCAPSFARGGGGFGGGGGGRMGGGIVYGGGRTGGGIDYRGYDQTGGGIDYRGGDRMGGGIDNRGFGGDGFRGADLRDNDRPSAFSGPAGDRPGAVSDAQREQAANQTWNSGRLSTDGGFGQLSNVHNYSMPNRGNANVGRVSNATNVARAADVRHAFNRYDSFGRDWWGRYPGSWYRPWWRDRDPYWAWGWGLWSDYAGWWDWDDDTEPTEYDYGDNITYQNNQVYYGSQPAATAEQYYTQAQTLATNAISKSTNDDWKPLGVFSLVQGSQTNSTALFQLAVNKDGAIAGNYYNMLTNDVKPVHGAIDRKSMRVAWTVQGAPGVVYDSGFANLMQPQSPILVHFSKAKTQQFSLVRMQQPTQTSYNGSNSL